MNGAGAETNIRRIESRWNVASAKGIFEWAGLIIVRLKFSILKGDLVKR